MLQAIRNRAAFRRAGNSANLLLLAVSLIVSIGVVEIVLRCFFGQRLEIHQEERSMLFHYDEQLGWFPDANKSQVFVGSHPVSVSSNSRGFRDSEHVRNSKPGIVFIGDSFVWGYDVEASDRFTDKLRPLLPDWNIYNLGVSGYATDQEWLLLQRQYDYYQPRIVFLVYCSYNDDFDNTANSIENGWYYKPYFRLDPAMNLKLCGVPVPKSLSYFGRQYPTVSRSYVVRLAVKSLAPKLVKDITPPTVQILTEMDEYVRSKGGRLVVGLTEQHYTLQKTFTEKGIPSLILTGDKYTTNGFHWTPAGHTSVCNTVHEFLKVNGLLDLSGRDVEGGNKFQH